MKRLTGILILASAALILAACSSAPASREITIEMSEFAYSPESIELQVGQEVTIHLVNNGAIEHELMIGREVVNEAGNPASYAHDMFEDHQPEVVFSGEPAEVAEAEDHEDDHDEGGTHEDEQAEGEEHGSEQEQEEASTHEGFMITLPGNSEREATFTFTVTEDMVGEWEMGCFLDGGGHYSAGMVGKLIVKD